MAKLGELCAHIRSKNAGPFWITMDLWFPDLDSYRQGVLSQALQPAAVATLYGVDVKQVKRFEWPDLLVLKISYPRPRPQGGFLERDMHGGQQYARLLDIDIE